MLAPLGAGIHSQAKGSPSLIPGRQAGRVVTSRVGSALAAAGDLVLPRTCAGCGRPGAAVCRGCRRALSDLAVPVLGPLAPYPVPRGWPGCHATIRYEGVAARLARAFKDEDRRDLADLIGRLLADAVRRTVMASSPGGRGGSGRPVVVVPVPSSPAAIRERGDRPLQMLADRAARLVGPGVRVEPALRVRRGTADQAGLDRAARLANLDGAMSAHRPHRVSGQHVVLVDDVLTSGATLTEGRRALLVAGASQVDLAVAMVTPRRSTPPGLPFRPRPD